MFFIWPSYKLSWGNWLTSKCVPQLTTRWRMMAKQKYALYPSLITFFPLCVMSHHLKWGGPTILFDLYKKREFSALGSQMAPSILNTEDSPFLWEWCMIWAVESVMKYNINNSWSLHYFHTCLYYLGMYLSKLDKDLYYSCAN